MVGNFADSIKLLTMFFKKPLMTQKKLKDDLEIMLQNAIYICIFWYSKIYWIPMKKYIPLVLEHPRKGPPWKELSELSVSSLVVVKWLKNILRTQFTRDEWVVHERICGCKREMGCKN